MKHLFLVFFSLSTFVLFSQIQKDTSYTVISTFKKEIKKFPFIKIVNSVEDISVTKKENIIYKKTGETKLHLDAFFKNDEKNLPAVVIIHGGGWSSGDKKQMHTTANAISAKGYACFCVEYRLSDEAKFPASINDVKDAIKYIKANAISYNVNATKVAVLGCSSGGQMAALVATTNGKKEFEEKSSLKQSSDVQAIIDMDGILAFHHPESKEAASASKWLGGTYEEKKEIWENASTLTHTDKNTPPILFINSSQPRFHAGRDDMIAILNKFGIYNEVKEFPSSPHSFWFFEPWFDDMINVTTQFLDKIFKQK
ncbi:alpha/beta hydrolase [Flavobacterium capsici]|uniref:Alpha/beta hydrolase n=1 Tax=Flavobacterium capsici TaxID=3075618 RepID=A0AA96J5L6_9FLAO|nr:MULTISPECIES: alpha/beta hydrolase [unclassified Flavobacterium]WNM17755.1 alpha/beta hydrolase [Flavobacterium sp. PMR2A8]WNM21808.1 alpha/beta hydrolase [Flavobacterium sp. PMTSA4]